MATDKTKSTDKTTGSKSTDNGSDWSDAPDPIMTDAFWFLEEGNVIEGVIADYDAGTDDRSAYYKVRLNKPTLVKNREGEGSRKLGAGIVGVNENAKLRFLRQQMKRGPVAVRIENLGRRDDGRGWDLRVQYRPAF